jgi:serine/threonine protein kinase
MAGETVLNGRYQLVAQQGSGGMSVIYKAIDRALGRTVAVKILRPSLISDPTFLEKFRAEARAVANLSHPNIVTVYDVGSDGPTHYIVMEIVEGQDLKKVIKTVGTLPIDRAVDLAIQICAGVGYAHRSGLVHADVKPQNILLTAADVVKVTDFGIAQALTDTQPQQRADVVWGSPHYFAPEQARGEAPAPQADVYAIGIVVFEMLTGRLPYAGANQQELAMAHIREPIPNISDINPAVPDRLSKMVYRAMLTNSGMFCNSFVIRRVTIQRLTQMCRMNHLERQVHALLAMMSRRNIVLRQMRLNLMTHASSSLRFLHHNSALLRKRHSLSSRIMCRLLLRRSIRSNKLRRLIPRNRSRAIRSLSRVIRKPNKPIPNPAIRGIVVHTRNIIVSRFSWMRKKARIM